MESYHIFLLWNAFAMFVGSGVAAALTTQFCHEFNAKQFWSDKTTKTLVMLENLSFFMAACGVVSIIMFCMVWE
ncbi:TMhelix containing protein [Vibrio phage 3.058.O._10N.286.46.B8]|uniref:hypothetical protein n=1 Tax=Vibrio phage henriette 12B8 TaxID=573174 RepID=UPI0002C0D137|nr:hypothetical protein VPDG_00094 [Vibrio phage henriette 12B8]AGG58255.1 hypothetical protein VPDG_00094 [Vibrio phage henriette 12B8]AUS01964.1 TMhelix containing protein [Vibrio phage 2.058.O._10N.286.46.B8]AUS03116.1 TMhelix containing protein [Vibrio phage 3.058.O._10N.286.46.B8]